MTGSGFWKATGIDKPVHSHGEVNNNTNCIGLKKTLVYYRGSAGKGTKTDWMMHEFRLPAMNDTTTTTTTTNIRPNITKTDLQEAVSSINNPRKFQIIRYVAHENTRIIPD